MIYVALWSIAAQLLHGSSCWLRSTIGSLSWLRLYLSHLMRLWHFSSSVNSFFKRACAAIQWIGLRLIPYFIYTNGEGSGETARMPRLAWAFTGRLYDKYQNLMSGLIFSLARHIVFQDESLTLCLVIMFFHGIFFCYLCSSLIKPLKLFFYLFLLCIFKLLSFIYWYLHKFSAGSLCTDRVSNCKLTYGYDICIGSFAPWAEANCMRSCGVCCE